MATVSSWNPFGVAMDITATGSGVKRTSATTYTVVIDASWKTHYSGNRTNYGMKAISGGQTAYIPKYDGSNFSSGNGSFTGTYSISGNGAQTKTITVTFTNYKDSPVSSASKNVTFDVSVPAWTSYTVSYNANGGSGAPGNQTKWKDQSLTLSSVKPSRTGYSFVNWNTNASGTGTSYNAGATYTGNATVTLYAVWKANTYTVSYNANGGSGAPGNQTKTYGVNLTLSSTKPTRTNYNFIGWGLSAAATTIAYSAGGSYTKNETITLYAIWETAYTKPKVKYLSVARCDASGNATDIGTYAKVEFDWSTYEQANAVVISWTGGGISNSTQFQIQGTNGNFSQVVGGASLSVEVSFSITITIKDSGGLFNITRNLSSQDFPIDILSKGKGVAFGKTAELEGVADFGYAARFNKPVYGKVLGMDIIPEIGNNQDLDDYTEPGCYGIGTNNMAETCTNIPVPVAGRLEVWAATGRGISQNSWSYIRQRFIPYRATIPVYERSLEKSPDTNWATLGWYPTGLSFSSYRQIYDKAAMTISLSNNTTLGVANSYARIPFDRTVLSTSDRLTLSDNSIRIGAHIQYVKVSGQTLVKFGSSAGSKHARIQKVSGSTVTNISWTCIYGTAGSNTLLPLTPVIVPVTDGDLIRMVYHTGDSTDTNTSGSVGNGWQTYLTVEEL